MRLDGLNKAFQPSALAEMLIDDGIMPQSQTA